MSLVSRVTTLIGRTQSFGHSERFLAARDVAIQAQDHAPWSTRKMLAVSAMLSVCLWAPIVFFAAKAFGG